MEQIQPAGPWTYRKLNDNFYDPGMLFEGDYIYVSCGIGRLHVVKLDRQFNRIEDKEVIRRDDSGLEGSKIYHIGQYYYIYATYGGTEGSQTIFRATTKLKLSNVTKVDKQALTRVSFQTNGGKALKLKRVFLSDDGETPTGINEVSGFKFQVSGTETYDLQGRKCSDRILKPGIYIRNGRTIVIK